MKVRFLLGPAGSGKTHRCLAEARQALVAAPEGAPLVFLTPKQTTYQVERQLLAEGAVPGYTRLQVLSFERLGHTLLDRLGLAAPKLLDEEGRLMVLRGLLARKREELRLFRASARLAGFARQLSLVLRELQRHQITPEGLTTLASQTGEVEGLGLKLQDLATLLRDYQAWLRERGLKDADSLLDAVAEALSNREIGRSEREGNPLEIEHLWVDGFIEWSPQELSFLAALLPGCANATFTFCLDREPAGKPSWLSSWSHVQRGHADAQRRFSALPGVVIQTELLGRDSGETLRGRFGANPVFQHLEAAWEDPRPFTPPPGVPAEQAAEAVRRTVRLALCADPEAEATLAAREILRHVRAGGRFRDVTVLVRRLAGYHEPIQRVLARYEIPFFMDRRESVSHHPLAELTRSALRTLAFGWRHEDWFAALKTGLAGGEEKGIDLLENEALARGWRGRVWREPIRLRDTPRFAEDAVRLRDLERELEKLRRELVPPFERVAAALGEGGGRPTGPVLANALRELWNTLNVRAQLEAWAADEAADTRIPASVHATVWEQANAWLANVEMAFPREALSLREWLPILDAGLANLSVGIIPPALDQVLVGAIDRSRNPDVRLALVLGLNESVFPAPPEGSVLLTDADRTELERRNVRLGATARQQLGRERFHAYLACTRARARVVLTCAQRSAEAATLNPSPFLDHLRLLFPTLDLEIMPEEPDWRESEHLSELVTPLLKAGRNRTGTGMEGLPPADRGTPPERGQPDEAALRPPPTSLLEGQPAVASLRQRLRHSRSPDLRESLDPVLAGRLYGPVLRSSVSRMEQFAACPFKFFVHSGLRAEERKRFELDVREQGSFQHDVLAMFHEELRRQQRRWRDLAPAEARALVAQVADALRGSYHDGLLQATEESRFMAQLMTRSLQDFVETLVGWMRGQYLFDPVAVELPFGEDQNSPAWRVRVDERHALEFRGRIDRVDLHPDPTGTQAQCVVIDYKSSEKKLDPLLLANGLQLQLLTYLNVLRRWPEPKKWFGVERLVPTGVFYVSLRGRYERGRHRREALDGAASARKHAYRHFGRFDVHALRLLDARSGSPEGDQFNYRLTKTGQPYKTSAEALEPEAFAELLDSTEATLRRLGSRIYAGDAAVAPYRRGVETACQRCDYQAVCRIDPWTHRFRTLTRQPEEASSQSG